MNNFIQAILAMLGGLLGIRCPWCGTTWPLWGEPEWGWRTVENMHWCKHCGRGV